jgi:hypothetical protein
MGVYEILAQAIQSKSPCLISKPGQPSRSICPNRIGRSSEGVMNVVYYQFDGYTTQAGGLQPDGSVRNWRCNHVADIATASLIEGRWHEPDIKPKTRGHCVADPPDYEVDY